MLRCSLFVRLGRSAVLCLAVLLICGCGTKTVPVSGQVTFDGEPLANAHLSFMPVATEGDVGGMSSYATTDDDGRYTLKLLENDDPGAVVGMHRVRISASTGIGGASDAGSSSGQDRIPRHERTRMFEVPPKGTDSADFALTSEPQSQ